MTDAAEKPAPAKNAAEQRGEERIRLRYRTDTIEGCERAVIEAAKAWRYYCTSGRELKLFNAVTALLAAEAEREKSSPAAQGESELRSERQPSGRPSKIR